MERSGVRARWVGLGYLVVTATGWALNWPGMKLLLREWPPLSARGVAGVTAAVVLAVVARRRGESLYVPRAAVPRLAFAAFTNVFAWMGFATVAMRWVSVAECALLVYSMPLWTMLFAWPLQGTRPSLRGVLAMVLGFAGLAVLLGGQSVALDGQALAGAGLALASAICFALGAVLNRAALPIPPVANVAWQVGLGCLPMLVLGLVFERPDVAALSALGWGVLVYMTVVPMGVCYLTWFATLRHLPPATAATGMLLVPVMGVVSAALLIGEPFGPREGLAMALTLGGVALALRKA